MQECTIILRKLAISLITHYSADNVIRQTLCNVAVLLLAVSIHIYAQPFIHSDANMAELGTLFATLLVLLVGLGSEHVQKVGGSVTDAIKNQPREDQSELSGVSRVFYSISYFFMVLFVFGTIFIIFRRAMLVLLQFKTGMKIALVCRRPPTPHYFSAILGKNCITRSSHRWTTTRSCSIKVSIPLCVPYLGCIGAIARPLTAAGMIAGNTVAKQS